MNSSEEERRLILQVLWGPLSFRKAIISPGQVLRVGRSSTADFSVPHDDLISETHFELVWDGMCCQLHDLTIAFSTILNGRPVKSGEVSNRSWIRAGTTDFSVFFEETSPPKETEEAATHQTQALEILLSQQFPLFAILDAARDSRILPLLQESTEQCQSLYEGPQRDSLSTVAPYLVELPEDSRLLRKIVTEGWGKGWGVYTRCSLPFLEVRRHLRKLLLVKAEGIEARLYFRFYDPQVLEMTLPIFTEAQWKYFFGPLESFIHEVEDGSVLQHTRDAKNRVHP